METVLKKFLVNFKLGIIKKTRNDILFAQIKYSEFRKFINNNFKTKVANVAVKIYSNCFFKKTLEEKKEDIIPPNVEIILKIKKLNNKWKGKLNSFPTHK